MERMPRYGFTPRAAAERHAERMASLRPAIAS
jgi:hypothetical protein